MFVRYDPKKQQGLQLYAPQGVKDGSLIAETLQPIEVEPGLAAEFAFKFYVWTGQGQPPGQDAKSAAEDVLIAGQAKGGPGTTEGQEGQRSLDAEGAA